MHLYDIKSGAPVYEVPLKTDPSRTKRPTLREARSERFGVGVTTIIGFEAAPALETWKVKQGIMSALTYPNLSSMMDQCLEEAIRLRDQGKLSGDVHAAAHDMAVNRIIKDSQEQVKDAAKRGTEVHKAIEKSLVGERSTPMASPALDAVKALDSSPRFQAEKTFCHPLGFGGAVDYMTDDWVIDFKTKDFTPEDVEAGKVRAYPNHRLQLVAYDLGVQTAGCADRLPRYDLWRKHANIFISRHPEHLGLTHVVVHDTSDADKWLDWQHFFHLLRAFQCAKRIPARGPLTTWGEVPRP